jgi:hypothetical protein
MGSEFSVFFSENSMALLYYEIFNLICFWLPGTLGRAEHEKSKAAVDFLSLAELWEHFAESGAYSLAVLVCLLGHVLPLRHPAIHNHQLHYLQVIKWF